MTQFIEVDAYLRIPLDGTPTAAKPGDTHRVLVPINRVWYVEEAEFGAIVYWHPSGKPLNVATEYEWIRTRLEATWT